MKREQTQTILGFKIDDTPITVGCTVTDGDGNKFTVREIHDKDHTVKAVKYTFSNPIYTLEQKTLRIVK